MKKSSGKMSSWAPNKGNTAGINPKSLHNPHLQPGHKNASGGLASSKKGC